LADANGDTRTYSWALKSKTLGFEENIVVICHYENVVGTDWCLYCGLVICIS